MYGTTLHTRTYSYIYADQLAELSSETDMELTGDGCNTDQASWSTDNCDASEELIYG